LQPTSIVPIVPISDNLDVRMLHISESTQTCAVPAGWTIRRWTSQMQSEAVRTSSLGGVYRLAEQPVRDWIDHMLRLASYGGVSILGNVVESFVPISTTAISVTWEEGDHEEMKRAQLSTSLMAGPSRISSRDAVDWYSNLESALAQNDPILIQQYLIHSDSVDVLPADLVQIRSNGISPLRSDLPETHSRTRDISQVLATRAQPRSSLPRSRVNRQQPRPAYGVPDHISVASQLRDPRGQYQFSEQ